MSDHEAGGAVTERELAAIDEALHAGAARHADPRTRELQELALALRADTPEAAEPFAAGLRERVEAGFPPPPSSLRARLRGLRPPRARKLLPALGTIGLILLPLVVIVLGTSGLLSVSSENGAGTPVAVLQAAAGRWPRPADRTSRRPPHQAATSPPVRASAGSSARSRSSSRPPWTRWSAWPTA